VPNSIFEEHAGSKVCGVSHCCWKADGQRSVTSDP
jgi:hypothetical protein